MSPAADDKSPLTRILDAGLYAPLGLLLTGEDVCDDLVAAGRKQVAFARSLGQAALKGVARGLQSTTQAAPSAPSTRSSASASPEPSAPTSGTIADYDAMTAREIIALVASASAEQLEWIRTRESSGKARVTVLRAVDGALA